MLDDDVVLADLAVVLPQAVPPADMSWYLDTDGRPLLYVAFGDAREWIEKNVLVHAYVSEPRTSVRPAHRATFVEFWELVERAAEDADRDRRLLLMIELYEHVGWTDDVLAYLGPNALELLDAARTELAHSARQIGRWAAP
ncbi:hypothetical protein [Paraconexibacter sp. AEG42_29]|uniref:hypothetical protein n=1 Tax=Paraconexibacter sp. AEG42_29 TaxID=2997339 RepID=UPI00339D5AB8